MRIHAWKKPSQAVLAVAALAFAATAGPMPAAHAAPGDFTVSPVTLAFGDVGVGLTKTLDVTITNETANGLDPAAFAGAGTLPVSVSFVDCTGALGAGATCPIHITFAPTSVGTVSGGIDLTLSGSIHTVSVSGAGILAFGVTPPSDFGSVGLGVTSIARNVAIRNDSGTPLTVDPLVTLPPNSPWAVATSGCAVELAIGATCSLSVTLTPSVEGSADTSSWLTLHGFAYTVPLVGTGVPALEATPSPMAFGSVLVGSSSASQTLFVKNTAGQPLDMSSLTATFPSGAPFSVVPSGSGACPAPGDPYLLATGAYCTFQVTFSPTAAGASTSSLSLTVLGHTYSVPVGGTGTNPPGTCVAEYRAPLTQGSTNMVQRGRVLPVKLSVTCGAIGNIGTPPTIQLLTGDQAAGPEIGSDPVPTSASAADTTGVMRATDGGYIYNLQLPSSLIVGNKYTIKVTSPTGDYDERVLLQIRK